MILKLGEKVRDYLCSWDMFASINTMRVRGSGQYQTIIGGIVSITMMLSLVGLFYNSLYEVTTKTYIQSSMQATQDLQSQDPLSGIMFAVGFNGINLSSTTNRYFRATLNIKSIQSFGPPNLTPVTLEKCSQSYWKSLGSTFEDAYSKFGMDSMLCPSSTEQITIRGHEALDKFQTLSLTIQKCINTTTDQTCASPADIMNYINTQISIMDVVMTRILILDNIVRGNQDIPVTPTLKRNIITGFTNNMGLRGRIYMAKYTITTDQSIFPYSYQNQESGFYVHSTDLHTIDTTSTIYLNIDILKSTQQKVVTRNHGKLDNVLSYIGGLFGLIFPLFMMCIGPYNQYKFQLYVGESAFENTSASKQSKFNFFTYIQYKLYQCLNMFCCQFPWKRMQAIEAARQQANQQLDIRLLMKKLNYYQSVANILLDQHQRVALYLSKPPSIEDAAAIRQLFDQSDKLLEVQTMKSNTNMVQNQYLIDEKSEIEPQLQKKQKNDDNSNSNEMQSSDVFMKFFQQVGNSSPNQSPISQSKHEDQIKRNQVLPTIEQQRNSKNNANILLSLMANHILKNGDNQINKRINNNISKNVLAKMKKGNKVEPE